MRKDYVNKFIPWIILGISFIVVSLYQFSVIAMHYIFGIISYIILILAFLISITKNIKFPYKRIVSLFISIVTLMLVFVFHFIICNKPFTFNVKKIDGGVEITGYTYNISNDYGNYHIEIPSQIRGDEVKSIGEHAFYGSEHFKDLIIPEGVEIIRGWAFAHANYKTIILPDSLKKIEHLSFAQADYLVDYIVIPNGVEYIGYKAFMNTSKIIIVNNTKYNDWDKTWSYSILGNYINPVAVQIINNVMYILNSNNNVTVALIDKNIENVEILEKIVFNKQEYIVTTIGARAGYDCTFKNINIPNTILSIEDKAFCNNKEIKSIFIPKNVIAIYDDVFYKCQNIIINTEHETKPEGWYSNWNCDRLVN